jgi:hypothetical protein
MLQFRFSHRPQRCGAYDSICTRCFATVARSHNEADLEAAERLHVCDEGVVMRMAQDLEEAQANQPKRPGRQSIDHLDRAAS